MRILRVTEALKAGGLIDDRFFTAAARDLGTATHLATQLDDRAELDEASVDESVRPRLEAWRAFRRDFQPFWSVIELRLYDVKLGITGQLDRLGDIAAVGRGALIDIKSPSKYPWHAAQIAAYWHLARGAGYSVRYFASVHLGAKYEIREYSPGDIAEGADIFFAALKVARHQEKHGILGYQPEA